MNPLDMIAPIGAIISKVLDFIPDPAKKLEAQQHIQDQVLAFAQSQATAQAQITDDEAKSSDHFTSRARPFILWICGVSIAYTYILAPFLTILVRIWMPSFAPPTLDSGTLMGLVTAMLGLGGMHAWENIKANPR